MRRTRLFTLAAIAVLLAGACGQQESEPATAEEPAAAPAAEEQAPAALPRTTSPDGARVFFITPADGDTVSSPVRIEFGIEGMNVVAAGVNEAHSGHHHLIIDAGLPDMGLPIPADENYVHFGDASTSTERELAPGEHTLQLLLGDHLHIPHDPPVMSETITITVK
ncbi:MAG: DUF4399 domain-containing protein [Woeseiaceae bacterium]|nr:DUF4399 domain-containing protein [Woeseiaceae bacterium]NIP21518.1 DUF4399 domain-containing protein [Woeseiaceae bacterium]NIS90506.1 DUF4399 domain-containing protein [Woeseiaceae bacterium]